MDLLPIDTISAFGRIGNYLPVTACPHVTIEKPCTVASLSLLATLALNIIGPEFYLIWNLIEGFTFLIKEYRMIMTGWITKRFFFFKWIIFFIRLKSCLELFWCSGRAAQNRILTSVL